MCWRAVKQKSNQIKPNMPKNYVILFIDKGVISLWSPSCFENFIFKESQTLSKTKKLCLVHEWLDLSYICLVKHNQQWKISPSPPLGWYRYIKYVKIIKNLFILTNGWISSRQQFHSNYLMICHHCCGLKKGSHYLPSLKDGFCHSTVAGNE